MTCAAFCWLASSAASVKLPGAVWRARFEQGLILTIETAGSESRSVAVVRDRTGQELFRTPPAPEAGVYEIRDLTLCGPRCLAVSVFFAPAPGQGTSAILYHSIDVPDESPRTVRTGDRVCRRIAGEPGGGLWCLGPDLRQQATGGDYPLVIRVDRDGKQAGTFLSSRLYPEPFQRSAAGEPALLCAKPGEALVWLPASLSLVQLDAASDHAPPAELPFRLSGRSRPTFALTGSGAAFALLPDVPPQMEESFATPYRLYRRASPIAPWTIVPGPGNYSRATELIGWDNGRIVVWNRSDHEVEWLQPSH